MKYTDGMASYPMDATDFKNFIFQGRALFTIQNDDNTDVTLSITSLAKRKDDPENRELFDVELKAINGGYQRSIYLGQINRTKKKFAKRFHVESDNPGVIAVQWIIDNWNTLDESTDKRFFHRGRCSRCFLELRVSESIETHLGPICLKAREKETLDIIEKLGIDTKGLSYVEKVLKAIETDPTVYSRVYIPGSIRRDMDKSIFETDMFEDVLF